ncbi:CGNR zinc finger domain-containing protein [Streptomyces cavernicola]|uniref:ABATE domain-containing protein n=1 Tax=Streptomyces cavernicola TaxID=3043613 RepID=A0ABT6SNP2_9ACTN|nr:ABATE domain-containing protein [Streptomyces sp. B-S-A6]MDI3408866.1 ABATE domain-containing protein [Streptomyces sp. B-S-A6]
MAAARASRFEAGRLCLDLLATAHPAEHLDTPDALRAWLLGGGLVPDGTPLADVGPDCVAEFRQLRADVRELLHPEVTATPAALARVNARAAPAPPAPRAVRTAAGDLVRALHPDPAGEALLAAVARDAVDLLTDPAARSRVRQCEGEDCPLIYLDTSRGRRRRWCSSEVCGNRVRVARHRRRSTAQAR